MGLEKRFAIIIGTNNYIDEKLKYSLKDAKDVSNILEENCKFYQENIHLILSNSEKPIDIYTKIIDAINAIKKNGFIVNMHTILFYFSGHGIYDSSQDESYLELSDTQKISIHKIYKLINELGGKNSYLIIDACHSGGEIDIFTAKEKTERKLHYSSKGIYCLFGATSDSIALEPTDVQSISFGIKNGILTHYLISIIKDKSKYVKIGNSNIGILSFKCIDGYVSILTQIQSNFIQVPVSYIGSEGNHPFAISQIDKTENKFEINNDLKAQICSLSYAKSLKFHGFSQNSIFYYDDYQQIFSSLEIEIKDGNFYSAFTTSELGKFIPAELEINERTFIAHSRTGDTFPLCDGWRFPNKDELEYPMARFYAEKSDWGKEDEYIATYRVSRSSIGHKTKDSYETLLFIDVNEANVRAKLLLELIKYKYLKI